MPCLNEASTLAVCVSKAKQCLERCGVSGEVVVADNGSTDGSQAVARSAGARVVHVAHKGYGSALSGGIAAARGRYVIMGDADDSYDFSDLGPFIAQLRAGNELVMGNRFKGGIKPGAMPPLHRYVGNPVLSGIGRLLFHSPCGDFHCGLRGFSKGAIDRLQLTTDGMEFASEMVVKATLHGLRITEVPTTLSPDGRPPGRAPHLRSFRDGWRHLRFLMLYSPRWMFLYPGILLILAGVITGLWLLPGPRRVGAIELDIHTLMYAASAVVIGFQAVCFAVLSKVFGISQGLIPEDPRFLRIVRPLTLEAGLVCGALMTVAGAAASAWGVWAWGRAAFGPLDPTAVARIVVPGLTLLTLGGEIILFSCFLSVLKLNRQ
jgi:hypothetical protein